MKEVSGLIKLQIKGGAANPAPPVGPALGSKGVNIMEFCKQFNARTQDQAGKVLPVIITVYKDKSFDFVVNSVKRIQKTARGGDYLQLINTTDLSLSRIKELPLLPNDEDDEDCFCSDTVIYDNGGSSTDGRQRGGNAEGGLSTSRWRPSAYGFSSATV